MYMGLLKIALCRFLHVFTKILSFQSFIVSNLQVFAFTKISHSITVMLSTEDSTLQVFISKFTKISHSIIIKQSTEDSTLQNFCFHQNFTFNHHCAMYRATGDSILEVFDFTRISHSIIVMLSTEDSTATFCFHQNFTFNPHNSCLLKITLCTFLLSPEFYIQSSL